jgi:hypothetical protein
MISASFLKKVYDEFRTSDFEITDDNLNPVREINFYDTFDMEALETDARRRLKAKIKELKRSMLGEGLVAAEDLTRISSIRGSESFNRGGSLRDFINLQKVGSTSGTFFNLNNLSLDDILLHDPLINEIDNMMISLLNPLYSEENNKGIDKSLLEDNYDFDFDLSLFLPGIAPFGPLCATDQSLNKKDDNNDLDNDNNSGAKNDADASKNDNGEEDDEEAEAQAKREEEAQAFLDALNERQNEEAMSLKQCALSSLGILKVIAIILTIIQIYRIIVTYIVSILVQISELVMLAAGIWINPTNIATIIAKILQVVMATLAQMLADIIKMLLDMLNANCLVQGSLDTLGQINQAMTAGAKTLKDTKKAISFTKDSAKLVAKKAADAKKAVGDAIERAKSLKDHDFVGDIKGQTSEAFMNGLKNGGTMALNTLKSHGLTQDILNTVRDSANAINDLVSATGDLMGIDFTAQKEKVDKAMSNIDEIMAL